MIQMRRAKQTALALVLAMMVLSFLTGGVQATGDQGEDDALVVSIESAGYLDLDGDQIEDDILTEFTISVPKGDWEFRHTYIYCLLELPSGYFFECALLAIGTYEWVTITLAWYNTAIEAGWYVFTTCAWALGENTPGPGGASIVFDPPTEGNPAPPVIEVVGVMSE